MYQPKTSYSGDPRWIIARFESKCSKCGKSVKRGEKIFYYPRTKSVFCDSPGCGGNAERDFRNMCEQEDFYGGRY